MCWRTRKRWTASWKRLCYCRSWLTSMSLVGLVESCRVAFPDLTAPWFAHTRSYHHGAQSTPDCTVLHTSDKLLLVTTGRLIWLLPWRRAAAWCSGLCTLQVIGKQAQGLRLASGRQGAAGSSPERAIVAACTMLHCQYARQIYHIQCLEAVTARSQEDAHQQRTLDGASHSLRQDGWKQLLQVRTRGASDLLM